MEKLKKYKKQIIAAFVAAFAFISIIAALISRKVFSSNNAKRSKEVVTSTVTKAEEALVIVEELEAEKADINNNYAPIYEELAKKDEAITKAANDREALASIWDEHYGN